MIFFTSDLHLGHRNIIEYCHRPFADLDAMNEGLIARWNEIVHDHDTVYIVGDLAMGRLTETVPLASRFRGQKILVPGNHDGCWSGRGQKASSLRSLYEDAGITIAPEQLELSLEDQTVQLCHFPFAVDPEEARSRDGVQHDEFAHHRPTDRQQWLLCGHVHSTWRQRGRQINVGMDAWGGQLVTTAQLLSLLRQGPSDRDAVSWS
jgi:calcineurin-like phosphoesterase family protein